MEQRIRYCSECKRGFDLSDEEQALDYFWGHDCEEVTGQEPPNPCCVRASVAPEYHAEAGCDWVGTTSDPGEFEEATR